MSSSWTCSLLAVFALAVTGCFAISMKSSVFSTYIEKSCYKKNTQGSGYTLGQSGPAGPLGQSMENFISLIEKIEQQNERANWRPNVLAGLILSRFHIDEFNYDPNFNIFMQEQGAKYRNRLREFLLDAATIHPADFPEESLTEDEKCSLYFMLSHHVNKTAQTGDKRTYNVVRQYPTNSRNNQQPSLGKSRNVKLTANPREYGVVSLRNNPDHAIAPARVLLGLIAAFSSVQSARVGDLIKLSALPDPDLKKQDSEVDSLLTITLGDIWAYGAVPSLGSELSRSDSKFGATGKWNSSVCQTEYLLSSNATRGSLAEIRGGIDGLLLGRKAKEVLDSGARFRLSSLLRMYYSPNGLFDDYTSVCRRDAVTSLLSSLKEQVKNYMNAFAQINLNQGLPENQINDFVEVSNNDWENALRLAYQTNNDDREWCDSARELSTSQTSNNQQCETASDVVVMVDLEDEFEQQLDLISKISNGLDMRRYGSSITVVANTKGGGYDYHSDGLSRIAWNSTNRGCVSCRLAWADRTNFGSQLGKQPDILLNNINSTLRDLKAEKDDELGVPGRSFLFFNYGFAKKPTLDTKRFYQAKSDLKTNHRDVPLIVIGKGNGDDLEEIAYDKNDVFEADKPDQSQLAKDILDRICQTPATFQHPECASRTSSNDIFTGFVTPGKKQYWSMYPQYFIKSHSVTFEFLAVTGSIKVCYRRGSPRPEEDERNCYQAKPGEESLKFRTRNPCHKYGLSDCNPLYFTVIGLRDGAPNANNKCKEEGCLNMDQIKWTVSHTGVSCNSSFKLGSSILLPVALLITALFAAQKPALVKF